MNVFLIMMPGIVGLAIAGVAALSWALRSGQFEDPKGAAFRILDDGDGPV